MMTVGDMHGKDVMMSDLKYWIWLGSLVSDTPAKKDRLIQHYADPAMVWEASEAELAASGLCTKKLVLRLVDKATSKENEKALESVKKSDADIITIDDIAYP